ncbi:YigZ family protein [bacterium]|nr:YigZ family protein [bacterium]
MFRYNKFGDFMKTIVENSSSILIIQKSKFITEFIKINQVNEVNQEIEKLKIKYPNATHYCFAYIIGQKKRYSDDGEPTSTAGKPILNVLEKNNLNYILCVVIRYFGGIKLGAGGLVRAYTKSVTNCLELSTVQEVCYGYQFNIYFHYENIEEVNYLLKDVPILSKNFEETVFYRFVISEEKLKEIKISLMKLCIKIEQFDKRIV